MTIGAWPNKSSCFLFALVNSVADLMAPSAQLLNVAQVAQVVQLEKLATLFDCRLDGTRELAYKNPLFLGLVVVLRNFPNFDSF